MRSLQNAPFCPIPASDSNFNPQNTQCIPACPVGPADRTGVVKIFAFLGLEPRLNNKNRFNWAGKIERFAKVSLSYANQAQFATVDGGRFSLSVKLLANIVNIFMSIKLDGFVKSPTSALRCIPCPVKLL
jgi:hypothetical protein